MTNQSTTLPTAKEIKSRWVPDKEAERQHAAIGVHIFPSRTIVLSSTRDVPRPKSHKPHFLYPADTDADPYALSNTKSCVSTETKEEPLQEDESSGKQKSRE